METFVTSLVTAAWWIVATPFIVGSWGLSLVPGVLAGGLAYAVDHPPVMEPVIVVMGPRYYSSKIDYPLIGVSQWVYIGDEPENPPPRCVETGTVDEETWAWKFEAKPLTQGLRGDETRGADQPGSAW